MNKTEEKAKEWLETQGYKNPIFQRRNSPDFVTEKGNGFEVKKIRQNAVVFSDRQWEQLLNHPNVNILLFDTGDSPAAIIPFNELSKPPSYWKQYRLIMVNLTERKYIARGQRLRDKREKLNLTQEDLARKLGVSVYSVLRWETGKTIPSPLAQKALEQLLNKLYK